jgi:5-methylcytosine-specific restriction endonuclease McrA
MKRTPLKRGTSQMKRTPFRAKRPNFDFKGGQKSEDISSVYPPKRKVYPHRIKKSKGSRVRLPKTSTMRNKCDALLSPIVKKMYPQCLFCPNPTSTAHHHIKKSTSSALRYYIPNLVNLCTFCHSSTTMKYSGAVG